MRGSGGGAEGGKKGGKNAKKKESGSGAATPVGDGGGGKIDLSSLQVPPVSGEESVPPTPGIDGSALDAMSKKIRKLTKKVILHSPSISSFVSRHCILFTDCDLLILNS